MTAKKQAVPYIRFSTKKQIDSNSKQRQEDAVNRWIAMHSDEYVKFNKTFEDLGKSASKGHHTLKGTGFNKLIQAIEDGYIKAGDAILIEAFDRATRQKPLDAIDTIKPILKAGVAIVTLDDGNMITEAHLDDSPFYILVGKIQAAHGYSKQLSRRMKDSYRLRREEAKKVGGEQIERHTPVWLTSDGKVKDDVKTKVVEVFDLYISGMGKHAIASRMRLSDVSALAKCSGPTVDGWLKNPAVIGVWANTDSTDEPIEGVYPPIIPVEKFHLVQELLKERATEPRKRTSKHFLVGLAKCAHCNATMVMHSRDGLPFAMRCLSHHRLKEAGCTNNRSIPVNVVKLVQVLTSQKAFVRAQAKQTLSTNKKRILAINIELSGLTKQEENLADTIAQMVKVSPAIVKKMDAIIDRQEALRIELEQIEAGDKVFAENLKTVTEQDTLKITDPLVLNSLLKDAGYIITCDQNGLLTTTEDDRQWKYAGVKRKAKSNVTEAYKVTMTEGAANTYLMINPDVSIEVPLPDPAQAEYDLRYARYAGLVIEATDAGGDEEHLDSPVVSWKTTPP